jgi:hypothetical protein
MRPSCCVTSDAGTTFAEFFDAASSTERRL